MKIMVGVNTLTHVSRLAYSNHCQMWFRFGRSYPDIDFILNHPERMSIDNMRNMTAKIAIANKCDYVLFIDDDVLVPIDALMRLIHANVDIAAGWTLIRGYPFKNMFFRFKPGDKENLETYDDKDFIFDERGNIPCDAVGFSCCLIKCSLIEKITLPWFATGPYNTEDIYFCVKAKEQFPETKIVVDPRIKTSHILGLEVIDPLNREAYKTFYETMFPESKDQKEPPVEKKIDLEPEGSTRPKYEEVLAQAIFGRTDYYSPGSTE